MKSICRMPAALGLVVLLTSLAPQLALAAEPTEDDANAAALAGRYQEALVAYTKLYSTTREPTYLHNIARCHQKLGHPDEAIDFFNRYLREAKDLEEDVKIQVGGYVREMEALKASRQNERAAVAAPAPAPASPAVPASGPAFAPVPSMPPADLATDRDEGGASSKHQTIRKAAAVTAGVALLATGVGVYYGVRSRTLENQVTSAKRFDPAADSDGATAHTMQFVMYGVAGALLASSAVLVYLSRGTDTESTKVSLLPSVGSSFAGGALTWRF